MKTHFLISRMINLVVICLFLALALLPVQTSAAPLAAAGALDPTFDGDGKVVTDIGGADRGQAVAIQSDGKIVVAGYSDNLGEDNYALARYNSNGSLDTSFDGDGKVVTDIRDIDYGEAIALQTDGKIVVAGCSATSGNWDFSLARHNSDGSLDATFDGDGKVVTDIGGTDWIFAMLIQPDGRIVVAGTSSNLGEFNYALARYNSDGSLDTTFDGDGKVVTDIRDEDYGYAIAIQTDGKIVVAGESFTGGNRDFSLARYNSDGSLDATFDGDGKVVTDIGGQDRIDAMAIQSDGRIVVAGLSDNWGEYNYALARYNSNGSLDTSFDGDGIVVTDIRDSDYGWAIALQTDGKIVVAGESLTGGEYDFSLARYNNDGSLDTTFDSDGKVVTDIGNFDSANAIAIQSDGKIIAAGESDWNFALARYLVNNAPTNIALSNSAVAENQPAGTLVGNLSTTDPDPGDTFTYSFCGGAGDGFFKISGSQLQTKAVFDYETNISYLICILSNDGHGGTVDDFFVINIIDVYEDVNDAPTDISLSNSSINENQPAGTTVGTLSTTDPDPGDTHTYSFCGGADDASFALVGDALNTAAAFDYEVENTYEICIRTDDGNGGTFDKNFPITVTDIPNVELVAPADTLDTQTNRPIFEWNAFLNATQYQIQISTFNDFSSKVTKAAIKAPLTSYAMKKDLLPNTVYYWRMAAKVDGHYGLWSQTWSFETGNPPPIPVLSAPGNKKTVAGPSPLFDWKDVKAIEGVTFGHYEIQISTDANFSTIVYSASPVLSQDNLAILTSGVTYYWRVRSVATSGDFSAWSKVRIVIIQ